MDLFNTKSVDSQNMLEITVLSSVKTFCNTFAGWYFEKLNTGLYERWVRHIFPKKHIDPRVELEEYRKFLNGLNISEHLDPHIAHKIIFISVLVFTILLQVYLILSCSNLSSHFKEILEPKILGSISFYMFLILPFKDAGFIDGIRNFLTNGLSYFDIPEFVGIDELAFLFCVLVFFLFRYIIAAYCSRLKKYKYLETEGYYVEAFFKTIKVGAPATAILLYSLGIILSMGNLYFMAGNMLLIFVAVVILIYLLKEDFYSFCENLFVWIDTHVFLLITSLTCLFYFAAAFLVLLDISLPESGLRDSIYFVSDAIFQGIFSQKAEPFAILAKIAILFLTMQYGVIMDKISILRSFEEPIEMNDIESLEYINDTKELDKYKERLFDSVIFDPNTFIYRKDGIEFFRQDAKKWKILGERHRAVVEKINEVENSMKISSQMFVYQAKLSEAKANILQKLETIDFSGKLDQEKVLPESDKAYGHFLNAIDALIGDYFTVISENLNRIISSMIYEKNISSELSTVILNIKKINFLRSKYVLIKNLQFCNNPWESSARDSISEQSFISDGPQSS